MIIVKLYGGLGNQMFQYALGRHLAELRGDTLKLDISFFKDYDLHKYSLSPLNIIENIATPEESERLEYTRTGLLSRLIRWASGMRSEKTPAYHQEKNLYLFDPQILKLDGDIYLDGYWQNGRYLKGIEEVLYKEFTPRSEQVGRNRELAEMIASSNSVNLHIRRGDYVSDTKTNRYHGTCDLDYYHRGAKLMAERVGDPHFFIFSDDKDWVSVNLELPYPMTFVDNNDATTDYEDLRLMTQCKNHIIANSTFSWWGAWLSGNEDKVIIGPERWVLREDFNTSDVLPEGWIRL